MEEEVEENGPSFPSNYVTIHELKQRWLQQQQQIPIPEKSNELNPKPTIDDDSRHRSINQRKPPPTLHNNTYDYASKTLLNDYPKLDNHDSRKPSHQNPSEPVEEKKQHHRNRNKKPTPFAPHNHHVLAATPVKEQHHQTRNQKPTHKTTPHTHHAVVDSEAVTLASPPPPPPVKEQHRSRNQKQKYKTKTPLSAPHNDDPAVLVDPGIVTPAPVRDQHQGGYRIDDSGDGDCVVADDIAVPATAPVKEAGQRSRNQNPKRKTKIPPFALQNDNAAATEDVVVAALVKEQHQARHQSRNKKVFRPKTPPFDAALNDIGVVEVKTLAVAAPVKLQHQATHRSRSQKPKHESKTPPFAPENDGGGDVVAIAAPVKEQHKAGHQSRNQKPQYKTKTEPFTPKNDDGDDGVVSEDVAVAAPVKERHQAGRGSRNKKVFRPKTPPFDVAGNDDGVVEVEGVTVSAPAKEQHQARQVSRNKKVFRPKTAPFDVAGNDDGVVEVEDVTVSAPVKEQHQPGRGSRYKKVFRPKIPLFDVVVDGGIGSGSGSGDDDGVVAAVVAASVEEIDVCNPSQGGYRRGVFEGVPQHRTWSRGPFFGWKKEQISQVWVKKGESAPN